MRFLCAHRPSVKVRLPQLHRAFLVLLTLALSAISTGLSGEPKSTSPVGKRPVQTADDRGRLSLRPFLRHLFPQTIKRFDQAIDLYTPIADRCAVLDDAIRIHILMGMAEEREKQKITESISALEKVPPFKKARDGLEISVKAAEETLRRKWPMDSIEPRMITTSFSSSVADPTADQGLHCRDDRLLQVDHVTMVLEQVLDNYPQQRIDDVERPAAILQKQDGRDAVERAPVFYTVNLSVHPAKPQARTGSDSEGGVIQAVRQSVPITAKVWIIYEVLNTKNGKRPGAGPSIRNIEIAELRFHDDGEGWIPTKENDNK